MLKNKNNHEHIARFYNEEYHASGKVNYNAFHLDGLARKIELDPQSSILDIACGTGAWMNIAAQYSSNTYGIDISETAINVCKANLGHTRLCIGLGEKLPFNKNCFDVVTCLGSLEHFLDQPLALKEIKRVAKGTAKVIILVPNSGFLTYKLGLYKGTNQSGVSETIRSINDWKKMFGDEGFTVKEMWADTHVFNREWIGRRGLLHMPFRALQALMLFVWPLKWQYQVYFLCESHV